MSQKKIPKKSFLFFLQQPPHASLKNKEALDFALSCAAFEQKVSVIFIDDGVYQLIKNQNTKNIHSKNHSASIAALALYGIEHCYYDGESAQSRKLSTEKLIADTQTITQDHIKHLIAEHDFVFYY